MAFKIIGLVVAVLGLIVNFSYKPILQKIFRVSDITDKDILKVKMTGLGIALVGAVVVFIFG